MCIVLIHINTSNHGWEAADSSRLSLVCSRDFLIWVRSSSFAWITGPDGHSCLLWSEWHFRLPRLLGVDNIFKNSRKDKGVCYTTMIQHLRKMLSMVQDAAKAAFPCRRKHGSGRGSSDSRRHSRQRWKSEPLQTASVILYSMKRCWGALLIFHSLL